MKEFEVHDRLWTLRADTESLLTALDAEQRDMYGELQDIADTLTALIGEDIDYSVRRVGSEHEESAIGDRAHCAACGGFIDDLSPTDPAVRYYHGDSLDA
jgi:hypothetical protein